MKNAIMSKIDEIAESIYSKMTFLQEEKSIGLYSGEFGILLFIFYYARYTRKPQFISFAEIYTEKLINKLGEMLNSYTYCNGLSGILYLFEFLKENEFIDIDIEDAEATFDKYIIRELRKDINLSHYDFMHGALGAGFYYLKKKKDVQMVKNLITFLYNTADIDIKKKTFKWKSIINHETKKDGYNISLSHGISSILLFLVRAKKANIEHDNLIELLEGTVNYIFSQQLDINEYGSFFPSQSLDKPGKSRLAWCYGDLGVATSLYYASKVMGNIDWENKALMILKETTKRRNLQENVVEDGGICHGSGGISVIYRRFYLETRDNLFLEAADYWVSQTLILGSNNGGLAGYITKGNPNDDYSLLTGISGIGLSFISYLENKTQEWDELFLIS